jgi:hypothetical protein
VFYLVSTYLQNNKLNKISPLIKEAENTFLGQEEVIKHLNSLKEKINPYLFTSKL